MNAESTKESEDLESTRDFRIISGRVSEVRERVIESGFERADMLRVRVFAQGSSMQSLGHAESQGLFSVFLSPCWKMWTCPDQTWMLGLWWKPSWILDSPWPRVQQCHRRGNTCCQDGTDIPAELAFCLSQVSKKGWEWRTSSVWKMS